MVGLAPPAAMANRSSLCNWRRAECPERDHQFPIEVKMKLLPRKIRLDEVEQEVTQRDQFNTDAVGLAEALVRESQQNSTDGESKAAPGVVRTRVQLVDARDEDATFWRGLLEPLRPHLAACDMAGHIPSFEKPRLLVIEDFGTTGLLGAVDRKDDGSFSDFWRRIGKSHKAGAAMGRWGLGKLVFSSSSAIRTFFGLTVREDDPARSPLLMGQAVLATHTIPGPPPVEYAPHAFFAKDTTGDLQQPENDPAFVAAFSSAAQLKRTDEPGLSIVIPFVHPEITPDSMLPHVIRNWFVPILTGRLVVEIGKHTLDATTLGDIARMHGGPEFADGKRVGFITELHAAQSSPPSVHLPHNWTDGLEAALSAATLEELRERYKDGHLISVRAPLTIQPKSGSVEPTHIDLFIRADPEPGPGIAFFVRGSMSIPGEARRFVGRNCFGAMIAAGGPVATFLGDAEGPAHTSWSGTAEKVTAKWKNPAGRLKEIRSALNQLYMAVARPSDRVEPDALISHFNVRASGTTTRKTKKKPVIRKPNVPKLPRRPANYRVEQRRNGFVVRGTEHSQLPLQITVTLAYDVIEGDPLKEYNKLDFDLNSKEIKVDAKGASYAIKSSNSMAITAREPNFSVSVTGFDENRDLFVGDRKV